MSGRRAFFTVRRRVDGSPANGPHGAGPILPQELQFADDFMRQNDTGLPAQYIEQNGDPVTAP